MNGFSRTFLLLLLALAVGGYLLVRTSGGDPDVLVHLVNEYRSAPQTCEGKRTQALGPLAPDPALSRVEVASAQHSLQEALTRAGYAASQAQAIVVSGPRAATSAMGLLKDKYCEPLLSAKYASIGVSREGNIWRIVLAQPLISADLGNWRAAGQEVLKLVNDARAEARSCGDKHFGAAPPVAWNATLAATALAHSREMAARNYFSHTGKGGSLVGDRANAQGYDWQRIGENIAAGQGSPQQVVAGWLASPTHCVNVMEPAFTQMGAAYAVDLESDTKIYWAQVFGTPAKESP